MSLLLLSLGAFAADFGGSLSFVPLPAAPDPEGTEPLRWMGRANVEAAISPEFRLEVGFGMSPDLGRDRNWFDFPVFSETRLAKISEIRGVLRGGVVLMPIHGEIDLLSRAVWELRAGLVVGGAAVRTVDDLDMITPTSEAAATARQTHGGLLWGALIEFGPAAKPLRARVRYEEVRYVEVVASSTLEIATLRTVGPEIAWVR